MDRLRNTGSRPRLPLPHLLVIVVASQLTESELLHAAAEKDVEEGQVVVVRGVHRTHHLQCDLQKEQQIYYRVVYLLMPHVKKTRAQNIRKGSSQCCGCQSRINLVES
jgi:hypothetical protein